METFREKEEKKDGLNQDIVTMEIRWMNLLENQRKLTAIRWKKLNDYRKNTHSTLKKRELSSRSLFFMEFF